MLAAKYFAVEISISFVQSIPSKYFDAATATLRHKEQAREVERQYKTVAFCSFKNTRFEFVLKLF